MRTVCKQMWTWFAFLCLSSEKFRELSLSVIKRHILVSGKNSGLLGDSGKTGGQAILTTLAETKRGVLRGNKRTDE